MEKTVLYENIDRLVQYGLTTGLTSKEEEIYTRNQLLEVFGEEDYQENDKTGKEVRTEELEDILKNLRDVQENIILFSGNQITPQSLEKQIDKLQQEMSALVKIIAQGGDSEFYAAKLRQLSEQKMGLTSQLQEIQKKKMADQAQEYQYQQALLYINNEENLNLTEFNDDFIRRIIEQITVLSATQIRIRFVGGYEQDANLPLKK